MENLYLGVVQHGTCDLLFTGPCHTDVYVVAVQTRQGSIDRIDMVLDQIREQPEMFG